MWAKLIFSQRVFTKTLIRASQVRRQSSTGIPDPSDKKHSSSNGAKWDQRKKYFPSCDYCHNKGHSKARCFKFIADERERSEKPVAFVRNDILLCRKSGEANVSRISPSKVFDEINEVDDIYKDFVYQNDVREVMKPTVQLLS